MTSATAETRPMAKKKAGPGRPRKEGGPKKGKLVRLDPDLVGKAKVITGRRNLDMGPYLSELLKGPIDREYRSILKELTAEEGSK
jgi:hypothetical protein